MRSFTPSKALVSALLVVIFFAAFSGAARAQSVALTFYTNTAPYAALGAPMGYFMAVTNTGTTNAKVTNTITLVAPDSTSYQLFTASPTITPGAAVSTSLTFKTSTYTSQTGAFTLTTTVNSSTGVLLTSQTIPLTVLAVPANGVYVSIGGAGPDTQSVGYSYDFQTVTANLSTASITVRTMPTLVK